MQAVRATKLLSTSVAIGIALIALSFGRGAIRGRYGAWDRQSGLTRRHCRDPGGGMTVLDDLLVRRGGPSAPDGSFSDS